MYTSTISWAYLSSHLLLVLLPQRLVPLLHVPRRVVPGLRCVRPRCVGPPPPPPTEHFEEQQRRSKPDSEGGRKRSGGGGRERREGVGTHISVMLGGAAMRTVAAGVQLCVPNTKHTHGVRRGRSLLRQGAPCMFGAEHRNCYLCSILGSSVPLHSFGGGPTAQLHRT